MDHINYERFSYLKNLKISKLNKLFRKLREPIESDKRANIIDYNWHVDGILKNSQSYNKEGTDIDDEMTVIYGLSDDRYVESLDHYIQKDNEEFDQNAKTPFKSERKISDDKHEDQA